MTIAFLEGAEYDEAFRQMGAAPLEPDEAQPPAQRNHRRKVVRNAQTARRDRLTQAANRLGTDTIDRLAAAVLSLSDEDAATLRACFAEVTRNS